MKTSLISIGRIPAGLLWIALALSTPHLTAAEVARVFGSPDEALNALSRAVSSTNRAELHEVLGSAAQQLINPDAVQGAAELAEFAAALRATNRWVRDSEIRWTLEIGPDSWPFPVPLVKGSAGWQFESQAGVEELLNRRIGRNELDVLRVLRAFVQAQREYASRDRDGDGVLEYAQRIAGSPGRLDGLYWPVEVNGEVSPLGPLAAYAYAEGYRGKRQAPDDAPQPFHGYLFRVLTRQGRHAPGGKHDYVINGNMIAGFAFVAWPAEYGESGIMTFIVNQQGVIYQQNLGPETLRKVRRMKAYDPDSHWQVSTD